MFFVDYWWIILQLGLAVFASARGWGFAPWALLVKGIILVAILGNINPKLIVVGGVAWPDMLVTLILFVMVAFPNDGEEVVQSNSPAFASTAGTETASEPKLYVEAQPLAATENLKPVTGQYYGQRF